MSHVAELFRYPVKSMLGESPGALELSAAGVAGDRKLALVDLETGLVATAKHPRLWRDLLQCRSSTNDLAIDVHLPDGYHGPALSERTDRELSRLLGRDVRMTSTRLPGATVERPDPEDVIAHGVAAEVPADTLEIAQGTQGDSFVDWGPVHVITTATLEHLGVEAIRYRPNIVIQTDPGTPPFTENDWADRELSIGGVRLRGLMPTPRCAVPTLAHGDLPKDTAAVRTVLEQNRVDVPGFGVLPSVGAYLAVSAAGEVQVGEQVQLPTA